MRTLTGKSSLEDPVSGEDSLKAEQSNYFEQVLDNSIATSEERLEQLRRVGCEATRRMATATGSAAAVKGWTTAKRSSFRSSYCAREEPSKLRAADYVERNDHAKRDGEVLVEAFNASRSMKVIGVNLHVCTRTA